jgi:hypothetical protein
VQGPTALWLASQGAPTDTIIKNNQFDETAQQLAIFCSFSAAVDTTNVFAAGREAALGQGCASGE